MKLVVVESPYAGDVERNLQYVRACMMDCLRRNESPYASHALLTQQGVLDDTIPEQRARGIEAGLLWGEKADLVACYIDLGWSSGMKFGLERAKTRNTRIVSRVLGAPWSNAAPHSEIVLQEFKEVPRAALAYVEQGDRILVVWNPHYRCWGLPGGREELEDGGELAVTLQRELHEELGVGVGLVQQLYNAEPSDSSRCRRVHIFKTTIKGELKEMEPGCPFTWMTHEQFLLNTVFKDFYRIFFSRIT